MLSGAPAVTAPAVVAEGQEVLVQVPATSANLGPGFDSLGLAVTMYDTITVRTTGSGTTTVSVTGEGEASLPTDESHLVAATILSTLERAGFSSPGLEIEASNVIPHGRGLGSSAAAIVSSVLAANALLPSSAQLDSQAVLQLCSTLEGHPDNVAPALLGSLAVSWETDRAYRSTIIPVHPDVVPVVAIPASELSTEAARALLPASVPHDSASANAGRAALLVHAMTSAPQFLFDATHDLLHQDYRAEAMLHSASLMRALRAEGFAAVISGAGPTVMTLAVGEDQAAATVAAVERIVHANDDGVDWRVLRLNVDTEGAKVKVHQR
ncbi:homoserine kinase [Arthrobacter sp. JZ12]|uniref:homoserine kinase n=1 Tax=Arthrobacter sp. JZ12 TaxID=2654190 RepID=UPI002B4AA1F6|nr:homoserine kinase [Arthrobacter sp. JZ12]WRH26491.1 homoserine kinase [Arthrobacter sp. JZ12]